jgi:hypothetical protein
MRLGYLDHDLADVLAMVFSRVPSHLADFPFSARAATLDSSLNRPILALGLPQTNP